MIERLIIVGLINSTEFIQQVRATWDHSLIGSTNLQRIAYWCIEYYDEYNKAPGRTLDDIYYDKRDSGDIPKDRVESLEEDLIDLAEEYDETFNLRYALDRAGKYLRKRHLELHQEKVQELLDAGEEDASIELASTYRGHTSVPEDVLDLSDTSTLLKVENLFTGLCTPLLEYPGALGKMLNDKMVRGAFVSLMAAEKRGKSFWLLDMAVRATQKRSKVAFFQAGDMTEDQQLKRICSYLTKKPSSDRYVGTIYVPVADCLRNQLDGCDKDERQGNVAAFDGGEFELDDIRKKLNREDLLEAYLNYGDDYIPCTNCDEFKEKPLGVPWLRPVTVKEAITVEESKRKIKQFFIEKKRRFRISTHPNNTLTVSTIKNICNSWERIDGFIPDVIVIDYADLLVAEQTKEFRHAQNEIWKNLRALSQYRHCLVLTATQADAKSYEKDLLGMTNYSEDKRKYAHVTAMFGLNQDKNGREKKMGVMRFNELVVREGEFDSTGTVTVLQNLNLGRPFVDCFI